VAGSIVTSTELAPVEEALDVPVIEVHNLFDEKRSKPFLYRPTRRLRRRRCKQNQKGTAKMDLLKSILMSLFRS
jgi:hypothetical protein